MQRRAEARGGTYTPPDADISNDEDMAAVSQAADANSILLNAAQKLVKELQMIDKDENLKAKERRSAKRKAEAIAAEESGRDAKDLLEWYAEHDGDDDGPTPAEDKGEILDGDELATRKGRSNPYIVFVGQLSYDTTKEDLFRHVEKELRHEHQVTNETVKIRLLTDPKTRRSRGMAFIETVDPELMYACLKLHHTNLHGRRINVERSAGGKKNSENRKTKLTQYREEQRQHISEIVDKMFSDVKTSGELQEYELDDGVVELCKRHSAATVEAALTRYLEKSGRDMDNPSAYFTYLIGKIAAEGPEDKAKWGKKRRSDGKDKDSRLDNKRHKLPAGPSKTEKGLMGKKLAKTSEFSKAGVDMSVSESQEGDLVKIFPSMTRGRGRGGRGYI
jgi:RNA recognition motif-containing protein